VVIKFSVFEARHWVRELVAWHSALVYKERLSLAGVLSLSCA